MSAARKSLKLMSLFLFVLGIVYTILGVMGVATGQTPGFPDAGAVLPILVALYGIGTLASAVLGIRAANKPSTSKVAFWWSMAMFAFEAVAVGLSVGNDVSNPVGYGMFIVALAMTFFTERVHKEQKERL